MIEKPRVLRIWALPPLLSLLGGCYLVPFQSTQCSATRGCPDGQVCDPGTSTCVDAPDQGGDVPQDMAAPECVVGTDQCTPCRVHADCQSLVCDVYQATTQGAGRCVPQQGLIYVDNHNGTCLAGKGGDGTTPATAACTLADGLTLVDGVARTAVRVMASSKDYGPVVLDQRTVVLYGPAGQGGDAELGDAMDTDGVGITGASDVVLDGFKIARAHAGVSCDSGGAEASVRLRRSQVVGCFDLGVVDNGCHLELDRVLLQGNRNGALAVVGGTYSITNSFLVKNRSSALPAVEILGAGTGVFRFNTVADNMSTLAAAIDCGGRPLEIADSIVFRNHWVNQSQFQNGCKVLNTVVGLFDSAPGGIRHNPEFMRVGDIDYGLNPDGQEDRAHCIDRARGSVATDYFGTARPLGMGYDIGAHEAR